MRGRAMRWGLLLSIVALEAACAGDPPRAAPPPDPAAAAIREGDRLEADVARALAQAAPDSDHPLSPKDLDAATASAERCLALRVQALGPTAPGTYRAMELVATAHVRKNDDKAETMLRYLLAAYEGKDGPSSLSVARILDLLPTTLKGEHAVERAVELRERALRIREAVLGPSHVEVARTLTELAADLDRLCRAPEAEQLLTRAMAVLQSQGKGIFDVAYVPPLEEIARAHWIAGNDDGAQAALRRAVGILEAAQPIQRKRTIQALDRLADMRRAHHDLDGAKAIADRQIALMNGDADREGTISWNVVRVHLASGNEAAARDLYTRAGLAVGFGTIASKDEPDHALRCVLPSSRGNGANAAQVVASMAASFRRCYQATLAVDRDITGSVRVVAHIDAQGGVDIASAASRKGPLWNTLVECVLGTVLAARFSPPEGGGATVVIPVTFASK